MTNRISAQKTYACGEDTKSRIIEAALEIFAQEGYEGASTRRLAEQAGVNLPALSYYFGNKEGLYAAVVQHIVDHMENFMLPVQIRFKEMSLKGALSKAENLALLCTILNALVSLITNSELHPESRRLFFARTEIEEHPAVKPLHESFKRCVIEPCAEIIAALLDRSLVSEEIVMRTLSIVGQVLIFCKIGAKRTLGCSEFSEAHVAMIQKIVNEHTQAIFSIALA